MSKLIQPFSSRHHDTRASSTPTRVTRKKEMMPFLLPNFFREKNDCCSLVHKNVLFVPHLPWSFRFDKLYLRGIPARHCTNQVIVTDSVRLPLSSINIRTLASSTRSSPSGPPSMNCPGSKLFKICVQMGTGAVLG